MNVFDLARAALTIAQQLGKREEWDKPAAILEQIAFELEAAGMPVPGDKDNRSYWEHMSVDDTLDQILATMERGAPEPGTNVNAYVTADGTTSVTVNIDATQATEATIRAVFEGMRSFLRSEGRVSELTPKDPYSRSADD